MILRHHDDLQQIDEGVEQLTFATLKMAENLDEEDYQDIKEDSEELFLGGA